MTSAKAKYRARRAKKMPSEGEMQRLADRAETIGCDRCGLRFAVALPYFVCRTPAGGFSVRCLACAAQVLAIAVWETGEDPWVEGDRQWFAAHPKRRWRIREAYSGEIAAAGAHSMLRWFATWRLGRWSAGTPGGLWSWWSTRSDQDAASGGSGSGRLETVAAMRDCGQRSKYMPEVSG